MAKGTSTRDATDPKSKQTKSTKVRAMLVQPISYVRYVIVSAHIPGSTNTANSDRVSSKKRSTSDTKKTTSSKKSKSTRSNKPKKQKKAPASSKK